MSTNVCSKKKQLQNIINECKGWKTTNEFLRLASINPIDFQMNLDLRNDSFKLDKITIQKIITNIDKNINKVKIEQQLFELADITADNRKLEITRGQIYWVDFGNGIGSEQQNIRPALVIQNNIGNKFSPTIVVVAITSKITKANLPTHVIVEKFEELGLSDLSIVLTEQVRTVDKKRVTGYIGECPYYLMKKIEKAIKIEIDLYKEVDITNFVELFSEKYGFQKKFKIALANEMKKYLETNEIEYKNNVNDYILDLRTQILSTQNTKKELCVAY